MTLAKPLATIMEIRRPLGRPFTAAGDVQMRFTIPIASGKFPLSGLVQHVPSTRLRTGLSPMPRGGFCRDSLLLGIRDKTLYVEPTNALVISLVGAIVPVKRAGRERKIGF